MVEKGNSLLVRSARRVPSTRMLAGMITHGPTEVVYYTGEELLVQVRPFSPETRRLRFERPDYATWRAFLEGRHSVPTVSVELSDNSARFVRLHG